MCSPDLLSIDLYAHGRRVVEIVCKHVGLGVGDVDVLVRENGCLSLGGEAKATL